MGEKKSVITAGRLGAGLFVLAILFWLSRINYLLFHGIVEIFCTLILFSIGLLVWHTARNIENRYLLFLGIALPAVGVLDLLHTLAYKGMGVFDPRDANTATQLWIAQRYWAGLTLLIAPVFLRRRLRPGLALGACGLLLALLLATIFSWKIFPACFVEPQGLTPFKKTSEVIVVVIFLGAGIHAWQRRQDFEPDVLRMILGAIALAAAADILFMFYNTPFGLNNMLGHLVNTADYYLIYQAIVVTGLARPQNLLYRDLKTLADRLEQMNRAKDDFIAMLGHELRNPLAPILNSLYVLNMRGGDEDQRRLLGIIERQTQQMARLVDDLLDVSRITRGKIELRQEQVDLNKIVRHAVESCQTLYKVRNHTLNVRLPETPMWLKADPARLEQILVNLLNNAAKYTDIGGCVWLNAGWQDGTVVIRVRDNGMGLSPELIREIFEPFSQAERALDRAQGGLGLGLTLVRSLARLHGGEVTATSPGLGLGSEFTVTLPLEKAEAAETNSGTPLEPVQR